MFSPLSITSALKAWSSRSRAQCPLTTLVSKRHFPLSRCTTWRNTGSSKRNESPFKHQTRHCMRMSCLNHNQDRFWEVLLAVPRGYMRTGGRFINTYELLNLRALKFSPVNQIHIFQCMGMIFCVEFQRYHLKFHTKYLTHTLKAKNCIQQELLDLRAHMPF